MRPALDPRAAALILVLDLPGTRKGYDDLASAYESTGMAEEAEVLRYLVSERFGADPSSPDEKQRGYAPEVP